MVTFSDSEDASFFVSSAGYGMHTSLLDKEEICHRSELGDWDEINGDIHWKNCIAIPHKNELEMGQELVFEFVEKHLIDDYKRGRLIFRKRGAYGRFKQLLEARGLLQH